MYHLPEDLITGFPALASKLSELKRRDEEFSLLADEYCEICKKTRCEGDNLSVQEREKLDQLREKRMQMEVSISMAVRAA